MMSKRNSWLFALLAALIGLGSLGVAESASAQVRVRFGRHVQIDLGGRIRTAPPPVRYEVRPPPPSSSMVWQPGYWALNGNEYTWVEGRYVQTRTGYAWRQPRWESRSGAWVMVPGAWVAVQSSPTVVYTQPSYPPQQNDRYGYGSDDNDYNRYRTRRHRDDQYGYYGNNDHGYDRYNRRDRDDRVDEGSTRPGVPRLSARGGFADPVQFQRWQARREYTAVFAWTDPNGVFHVRTASSQERPWQGRVVGDGGAYVRLVGRTNADNDDVIQQEGRTVMFDMNTNHGSDGLDFTVEGGSCARLQLNGSVQLLVGSQAQPAGHGNEFTICR